MQSRRNFGARVLSIFSTKIVAAIFDLISSGRLGRERKIVLRGRSMVKNKERGGGPGVNIVLALPPPPALTVHKHDRLDKRSRAYNVSSP